MTAISLLTDFGLSDAYVGIMKGVILSINPIANIVDITHLVPPQDVIEASYQLQSAYSYFPPETVHVVVVDPGVGSGRSIVCVESEGHRFLAPNNGVLTQVLSDGKVERAVYVENADFFLSSISNTFHGRDIFAPVAAHLSLGVDLALLGDEAVDADLVRLTIPQPVFSGDTTLTGTVISIDRFGNAITNIRHWHIMTLYKNRKKGELNIHVGEQIRGLSTNYGSVAPQQALAIIGSRGFLEISVNCGNAADNLGLSKGDPVKIVLAESG